MNAPTPGAASPTSRPRIAVVFGGRSSEHGISCVTAGSVIAAIDPEAYEVVPVGIAPDGRWVMFGGDTSELAIDDQRRLPEVRADGAQVALTQAEQGAELVTSGPGQVPEALGSVDVVFPLLHGPWGEDGTVQGLLEMADVRYVGSGVLASAVGMDKAFMKIALQAAGLPVLDSVVVHRREWERDPEAARERIEALGFPVFVKPARGGSSMGISKVHAADGLAEAMRLAHAHDPKVLVETFAAGGREVECGVLETLDGGVETTYPAEIRIGGDHEFYDFEAKYLPGEQTRIDLPADLPAETVARIRELAGRAFEAMDCEGLARVDFFVMPDGSLVINEINTMPGFTPTSMYPQMWAHSGLDYPALVDRLISLALQRETGLR